MIQAFLGFLGGPIARELRGALRDRMNAANEADRIEADQRIAALQAAQEIASIEAADRWSATRIGRLLIVLPYSFWWSAIFIDSTFNMPWDVLALPVEIDAMAKVLIPAIVIADAGAMAARRIGR